MQISQTLTNIHAPRAHRREHRKAHRTIAASAALAVAALLAPNTLAGPCWEEPPINQAGSTPSTAQITTGTGPLTCIIGRLGTGTALGLDDLEDMYLIHIDSPADFLASTSPEFGAAADFPTALWLFPANANAALANRAFSPDLSGSLLLPEATDATGFTLTTPGLYYLAITAADAMPLAHDPPLPMFSFTDPFEVSGPDGPAANAPINTWDQAPTNGNYTIILSGATFAAPPCPGDTNADGVVNADDLGILLANFGCAGPECPADLNADGVVDADDLGILLANFGTVCGPFGACCFPDGTCDSLSIYQCQQLGGLFQGTSLKCDDIICQTPPSDSTCCTPQPTPGCDDPACEAAVCAIDPFCCNTTWDSLCANRAQITPDCPCN